MTESRRKIDNCSFHLFVATLENLGPQNRTFTVLKDDNLSFPHLEAPAFKNLSVLQCSCSVLCGKIVSFSLFQIADGMCYEAWYHGTYLICSNPLPQPDLNPRCVDLCAGVLGPMDNARRTPNYS